MGDTDLNIQWNNNYIAYALATHFDCLLLVAPCRAEEFWSKCLLWRTPKPPQALSGSASIRIPQLASLAPVKALNFYTFSPASRNTGTQAFLLLSQAFTIVE